MTDQVPGLLFNVANPSLMATIGIGYGLLSFIAVIFIEARIMKKCFGFPLEKRIQYAFILNLISAIAGFFFITSVSTDVQGFFILLLFALVLTILIEGVCLLIFLRNKHSLKDITSYTIRANLISYTTAILAPYLIWTYII